jgi:hypothetical protein
LQAIRYAVNEWKVNIISMSFGYESEREEIQDALTFAGEKNVLLLAAASNVGGNLGGAQRWPGNRENVMSIGATEGKGFGYEDNPPAQPNEYNFATLGVMVPVWTVPDEKNESKQIHRTGTSIATPIAAAIAASVLDFIRAVETSYVGTFPQRQQDSTQQRVKSAKRKVLQANGMCRVFSLMARRHPSNNNGWHYVQPANLVTKHDKPEDVLHSILKALDE